MAKFLTTAMLMLSISACTSTNVGVERSMTTNAMGSTLWLHEDAEPIRVAIVAAEAPGDDDHQWPEGPASESVAQFSDAIESIEHLELVPSDRVNDVLENSLNSGNADYAKLARNLYARERADITMVCRLEGGTAYHIGVISFKNIAESGTQVEDRCEVNYSILDGRSGRRIVEVTETFRRNDSPIRHAGHEGGRELFNSFVSRSVVQTLAHLKLMASPRASHVARAE